ncbi:MAG: RDD family protein, partial [Streptosporangiaceae bacterium]
MGGLVPDLGGRLLLRARALIGQTAGKALLGLRVLRTDGAKARSGPIAIRTFLRLADELPAFYLLGFIVMLITGRRRLRLGDL